MKKTLLGTMVIIGATVGGATVHPTDEGPGWRPVTRGLTESPDQMLPPVISTTHPVRVVTTTLDRAGRPVTTTHAATDHGTAARLMSAGQHAAGAIDVEVDVPLTVASTDTLRDQQWDHDAMRVAGAWPRATGVGVTVAVIDSGVDATHPDLAGQVLPGADFITGVEGISIDPHGHGTHVAGTIAALAGNDTGIAGVAPGARILPVRVLNANGAGYMSDVANGIAYAAEHGADVINMSISATSDEAAVTNAIAYARSRGVVVVAAAGNSRGSGSPTGYPAADPGVLAVAATDSADQIAPYSTRGDYVDVAAPGSDILSTFPPALGAEYRRMSGTSMAAPHVAALAALLKSADRSLGPDAIERAIESSVTDLGAAGRDDDFGYGRVDAAAALATLPPTPAPDLTGEPSPAPSTVPVDPTDSPQPGLSNPTDSTSPGLSDPTDSPQPGASDPTDSPQPGASDRTVSPPPGVSDPSESPQPGASDPSESPRPVLTTDPVTPSPAPSPTDNVPTPMPEFPVRAWAARTGPQEITAVIDIPVGQQVEVQAAVGINWVTVRTYPAARMIRINGLAPGSTYRILVPAIGRFAGTVSGSARL